MQGRIAGFFMTVVMALPLAAIPLMSIFGIPQFGSLASTGDADTGFLPEDPTSVADIAGWDTAPAFSDAQPFGQGASQQNTSLQQEAIVVPVSQNLSGNTGRNQAFAGGIGNSLTWEQAIAKLARHGIHDYRLQPGFEVNTVQFACYLRTNSTDQANATVVRFEAEDAQPVQAVQKTLLQIEQYFR